MKKLLCTLMGVVFGSLLISSGCQPVQAEETAASVPPKQGNLHIHKYYLEDLELAGDPNDGNVIEGNDLPEGAIALPGIEFKLFKVEPNEGRYPEGINMTVDTEKGTLTDEGLEYKISVANPSSVTTNEDGIALAKKLEQGVYVVKEMPNKGSITVEGEEIDVDPHKPFIVHVPMTNPDGNGWLSDVHVYPKNEGLVLEKITESELSVNIGDTVSYRINNKVPAGVYNEDTDINKKISYAIVDELDAALTFNEETLKVYRTDTKNGDVTTLEALVENTDYRVERNPDFKVIFTAEGRRKISEKKFIVITFDAVVNENLLNKEITQVGNKANVEFTNKNGQELEKETEPVIVHTGNIKINKISARDSSALNGAVFQIASSEENAKNGHFLKKGKDGEIIDAGETGYDTASVWKETTNEANGVATFKGLKEYTATVTNGVESDKTYLSYWLVEVEAPEGYHLLDAPVQVTFDKDVIDNILEITIKNSKKGLLPKTGSVTSLLLSIVGIMIIGGGVIHLMVNNKKVESD